MNTKYVENINEDTQERPQSRSTALPRHQRKKRLETNKDNRNVTYETTDAQRTEKKKKKKKALDRSLGKLRDGVRVVFVCVCVLHPNINTQAQRQAQF